MKLSNKIIQQQAQHVNEHCLKNSIYQIYVQRSNGYYHAWLQYKERPSKTIKLMYVGNAAEMNAFLTAFQMRQWYMQEPF